MKHVCLFHSTPLWVGWFLLNYFFFYDHSIKRLSLRLCCQARGRSLTENFGNSVQAVRENPEYSYTELARVEIDEIPASVKGRFRCEDGFLCECRVKVLKHCPPPSYQPLQTYSVNRRLRNDGTYRSNVPPVSTCSIQLRLMGLENWGRKYVYNNLLHLAAASARPGCSGLSGRGGPASVARLEKRTCITMPSCQYIAAPPRPALVRAARAGWFGLRQAVGEDILKHYATLRCSCCPGSSCPTPPPPPWCEAGAGAGRLESRPAARQR